MEALVKIDIEENLANVKLQCNVCEKYCSLDDMDYHCMDCYEKAFDAWMKEVMDEAYEHFKSEDFENWILEGDTESFKRGWVAGYIDAGRKIAERALGHDYVYKVFEQKCDYGTRLKELGLIPKE